MKINIVNSQHIKPSSPTPSECRDYKLSFIEYQIPHFYIPLILYYSASKTSNSKQSEISNLLKTTLSETLTLFYPLAGRIKGQTSIDCNDQGILYLEAEVDGHLSDILQNPEIQILDRLSPCQSSGMVTDAKELLAIQVSFFECGGLAIGVCQSHRISDGWSICSFINCWAAKLATKARGSINMVLEPEFNSGSLFPIMDFPDFTPDPETPPLRVPTEKLVTKMFVFDSRVIELLKSEVMARWAGTKPTRVEVVSACIWKSCMAAKGVGENDTSVISHPVNFRKRMIPPLQDSSFGNMFQMAHAVTSGAAADQDWIGLAEKVREAFGKINPSYCKKLLGENGFEVAENNFLEVGKFLVRKDVHSVRFSSWCGFPIFEADFGWGNPVWVSSTSFSCKNHVFLFDSGSPAGGIEAWIVMAENEMRKFQQEMDLLNTLK